MEESGWLVDAFSRARYSSEEPAIKFGLLAGGRKLSSLTAPLDAVGGERS
jgi:hypothetical protein